MNIPARLYCLDVARGFAAFSVIIWHWQHFYYDGPSSPSITLERQDQPFYYFLSPFYENGGGHAVSFFFMLSGFVFFWLYREKIEDKSCSLKSFWLARFSRLYPLHLITLLIVLALQIIYRHIHSEYFVYSYNDSYHFLLQLFLGSKWGFESGPSFNAPIWSVSIEIGLYAIFFAMVFVRKSKWYYIAGFILFLEISQKLGIGIGVWSDPLETFLLGGLTFYSLRFYLQHSWRNQFTDFTAITIPISVWILMAVSEPFALIVLMKFGLLKAVVFPLTVVGLVLLEITVKIPFKRLRWVGDCTYSSYLLHFPLQILMALAVSESINSKEIFHSPWAMLIFFAILIPLSLATYTHFEVPFQAKIRSSGRKWLKIDPGR